MKLDFKRDVIIPISILNNDFWRLFTNKHIVSENTRERYNRCNPSGIDDKASVEFAKHYLKDNMERLGFKYLKRLKPIDMDCCFMKRRKGQGIWYGLGLNLSFGNISAKLWNGIYVADLFDEFEAHRYTDEETLKQELDNILEMFIENGIEKLDSQM